MKSTYRNFFHKTTRLWAAPNWCWTEDRSLALDAPEDLAGAVARNRGAKPEEIEIVELEREPKA